MRILIFCHHLLAWTGSEVVCLEFLEDLRSRGHDVRIRCVFPNPAFVQEATGDWEVLETGPACWGPGAFDLIIVLHQGMSCLGEDAFESLFARPERPYFAYFHLSPYEPFELPGPFIERALADAVFANSEETRRELALHGFEDVALFQNPAPAHFDLPAGGRDDLKVLLSVSNHVPAELAEAFEILKTKGVDVRRIGNPGGNRRVTPQDIAQCDAIVSIGKTVQYGIRSRRPVFCYDHFKGPGWLTPWSAADEELNFSGRSAPECLSARHLADLLFDGFRDARRWIATSDAPALERFHLEPFIDALLARVKASQGTRSWPAWTRENGWRKDFRTERNLYRLIDREYARGRDVPGFNETPSVANVTANPKLTCKVLRDPEDGEPMVVAMFSFRYDAHLVPDLIENIRPAVHGYVALDDRAAGDILTNEADRQSALYAAAAGMGAKWVFAVDPDERFEDALGDRIHDLTTRHGPVVWTFESREMFDAERYRVDGIWNCRPRPRLFPCFPGMEPDSKRLHGLWTRNAPRLPVKPSGLELFHLRMALPERRKLRRALYSHSDPGREFQNIGYDYLDDERGMRLRSIPAGRRFTPGFQEDGGIWAPQATQLAGLCGGEDPLPQKMHRVVRTRRMRGFENATHVGLDLMVAHPNDHEIALMTADSALRAGLPEIALRTCRRVADQVRQPLLALKLMGEAHLDLAQNDLAVDVIGEMERLCPVPGVACEMRQRLARSAHAHALPDALWRRWLPDADDDAVRVHNGAGIQDADIAVVVMALGAPAELADAVSSLRAQSVPCEIVVVNSGGGPVEAVLAGHLDAIRLITVETRLYAGAVRNIGIDASRAKYVAFLAADCLAPPGWLEGRLAAHRAGYEAVPCGVEPQEDASTAAKALWLWLYSARVGVRRHVVDAAHSLSYDRSLFRDFGYFPPGARIGEDSAINRRLNGAVEIAGDVDISLVHSFESTSAEVANAVRERARRRVLNGIAPKFSDPDRFRARIQELKGERLSQARSALDTLDGIDPAERVTLENELTALASIEEVAALEAGDVAFTARGLKSRAEALLETDPDQACFLMEEAIMLWPNSAELHLFAARCAKKSSQDEHRSLAVGLARESFSINPDYIAALTFAINTLAEARRFQEAAELLVWAHALNPCSFDLANLARLVRGRKFRAFRMMFAQRAFFLRPWATQPNTMLARSYRDLWEVRASMTRRKWRAMF